MSKNKQQSIHLASEVDTHLENPSDVLFDQLPFEPAFAKHGIECRIKDPTNNERLFDIYIDKRNPLRNRYRCAMSTRSNRLAVGYFLYADGQVCFHRFGGPCYYEYNYETGLIEKMEWCFLGMKYSYKHYWATLFLEQLSSTHTIYTRERTDNKERIKLKYKTFSSIPCPDSYFPVSGTLVWKINGKRVSVEEYFTKFERVFSVVPLRYYLTRRWED